MTAQSAAGRTDEAALDQRLALLGAGDEQAWTVAFRELWPVVLRAARHPAAGLTAGEAEEVASEALAQLVSRVSQVATFEQLTALAATIAHRRAISAARAKSAIKRGPGSLSRSDGGVEHSVVQDIAAPAADALSEVELAEMALLLREALNGLEPTARSLLEDKLVAGFSYQELGVKYRMPLGTVCAKVARSLQRIRKRLDESPGLTKELRGFLR